MAFLKQMENLPFMVLHAMCSFLAGVLYMKAVIMEGPSNIAPI